MPGVTIYHNPRCSKSRQTLQLVRDEGIEPKIVEYLEDPPDEKTIRSLLRKLGLGAWELLRRKEAAFGELNLAAKKDDETALVRAMARRPALIERPIVVCGRRAALGRPPQQVLEILEEAS